MHFSTSSKREPQEELSYLDFAGRPALPGRDDLDFDPLVIVERLEKRKELKKLKKTPEPELQKSSLIVTITKIVIISDYRSKNCALK